MHKPSSKIRPLHLRVALAESTWSSLMLIEDLLCVRRPGESDRVPMSEHPGRCPSIRASVYERRYCLCPSAVLMDWLGLVLTRPSDSLGHGRSFNRVDGLVE
ncbi:unnamed protein product [Cochlearia groenlandica]